MELTATASSGYSFVNWTNYDGSELATTSTINVNVIKDSTIKANFEAIAPSSTKAYIVAGSLPKDGQLINKDGSGGGSKTMKNEYKVSFVNESDASKQYKIIYEIKNTKGRTIYKKEEIVSKNDADNITKVYEKEYLNLRPSGNGTGTIVLTIKDMKGKVIATDSRTFEVEGIPPRIIQFKKVEK